MNRLPVEYLEKHETGWRLQAWHVYLALIGLLIRVGFGLVTSREAAFGGWDGKEYYAYAHSLLAFEGDGYARFFTSVRPPFYSIFLMPFVAVTDHVWPIQVAQSLLGISQAFMLAYLAGRWRGPRAGNWAFILVLFCPFLIYYSAFVLTETLFITLLWAGIACLYRFNEFRSDKRVSLIWLSLSAGALGLACLTRPTLQPFLIIAVLWIGWRTLAISNVRTALARMACFTVVVSALLLPWMARNSWVHGQMSLSPGAGAANYALSNSPDYLRMYEARTKEEYYEVFGRLVTRISVEAQTPSDTLVDEARAFRQNDRAGWWRLQWYKFKHFWTPWLNPLIFSRTDFLISLFALTPLFLLAAFELWRRCRAKDSFVPLLIGLIAVGYLVGGLLFHVQLRYRFPFVDTSFILLTSSFLGTLRLPRFQPRTVQWRGFLAKMIPAQTRGQLINLEVRLKQAAVVSTLARFLEPWMIQPYLDRPHEVDIEVTSSCDADCIMCPRKAIRRKVGPMDFSLFKKIVDEAVALNVQELYLNGYGEISVLRNYQQYISYIRQKSRSIKININTNGMRMNEQMARFYVDSRVNTVNVTIDGATAATYESIRRHLKLEVVEANVKQLIRIRNQGKKKYPLVTVGMIGMPQNAHEIDQFRTKWHGVADRVVISGLVSRINSVKLVEIDNPRWQRTPCFLLWRQMPILSDGTVALCCDDWDGKAAQGNLRTQTIKEIWTSRKRQGLRGVQLSGNAGKIPLCASCKQPRQGPVWFGKARQTPGVYAITRETKACASPLNA